MVIFQDECWDSYQYLSSLISNEKRASVMITRPSKLIASLEHEVEGRSSNNMTHARM